MTDTPGREPEAREPNDVSEAESEQRLPVPRPPSEAAPVERFSSVASTRAAALTPERFAQVVRQSSNARWVGFLATVIVVLFVALYWFYEVGGPLGVTEARLESELDAQQVRAVERGYNIYEANCARCHGADGEGGIGPALNRQDKLFSHLNEDFLRNVLTVGGRYVCGDPNSIMPVWSDEGHPPGPLNYRAVDELIAFLRAPSSQTYTVRDEELLDPVVDPVTGQVKQFTGWVDESYQPEPGATPYPDCWQDEFTAGASGSPAPAASIDPNATVVEVTASGVAFTAAEVAGPADVGFTLSFHNQDASIPHDVQVKDAAGAVLFKTEVFPGVETRDYSAPALAPGEYTFFCSVHPNMTGTWNAE